MQSEPVVKFSRRDRDGIEHKYVAILGVELPVYDGPDGSFFRDEEFAEFSHDEASIDLLRRYATAARLGQPVLIEGETDIGKSKALEYLAHLCNRRLFRLSLSGQTDVSEFVGKYVPNTEDGKTAFERILRGREKMSASSRAILGQADEENRGMTEDECRLVAKNEGLAFGEKVNWIWQDGLLLKAMRHGNGKGAWLYLDELGAAEPQILVKINRVFEKFGRMEVAENGNRVVEAGPDFRLFATTNPPEYAGRLPFAPDFLRRFVYQKVGSLSGDSLKARIRALFRKVAEPGAATITKFGVVEDAPINFVEHPRVSEAAEDALLSLFEALKQKQAAGLGRDQRQQFRFEFSDLQRIFEYVSAFGGKNPFEAMKRAVEFYFANKLGKPEDRLAVMAAFKVVADAKNTEKNMRIVAKAEQTDPAETSEAKAARTAAVAAFDEIGDIPTPAREKMKMPSEHIAAIMELFGGGRPFEVVESPSSADLGLDALLDPANFERLSALTPEEVTAELDRIPYVALNFPAATSDADKARGVVRHRPNWWSDVPDLKVGGVPVAPTLGLAYLRSIAAHQDSLAGATLLLDSAPKPRYIDGSQHYGSAAGTDASLDPLLPLFREAFGDEGNRFSRKHEDIVTRLLPLAREKVRAALAARGLPTDNVDVILAPFAVDQNFMVTTSPESSATDTWEWTSTQLIDRTGAGAGRFLLAGYSGDGGAGYVDVGLPSVRFVFRGARLAVVFRP